MPKSMTKNIKDIMMDNGSYKIVALLITLILWITVLGNKDQVLSQNVKINFVLPKNQIIANAVIDQVQVEISGSRLSLKKLSKGLDPIQINLEDAKPGRTLITIPTESISLPFGAQILRLEPATVIVDVDRIMTKRVPVKITWDADDEPTNLRILDIKPASVIIKGASTVLTRIQEVWTEPISPMEVFFDKEKRNVEIRVGLKDFNYNGVLPIENRNVSVVVSHK